MKRPTKRGERGFALLFIVMIVAVVAVAAAALLDIVEVDILIAGEHRRSTAAQTLAEGAIVEIQTDTSTFDLLPQPESATMQVRLAGIDGTGDFVRDPDGIAVGPLVLNEFSSSFVRNNAAATSNFREGYSANMRLLRTGPALDNGVNTVNAIVYEVQAQSAVSGGQATSEITAEMYSYGAVRGGVVGERHAR